MPVNVSIAESIDYDPDQWVFIYAREWGGSPMPLAITRIPAEQLPMTIVLDDTMAMSSAASLGRAEQVELVARLSLDGDAIPKPGDWQGTLGPVSTQNIPESLELVIDEAITEDLDEEPDDES